MTVQVFCDVWQQRQVHPQLLKLLATWEGIFPPQLLAVLKQRVNQGVPTPVTGNPLHASQAHSNQWSLRVGNEQQPVSSVTTSVPSTSGRNGYYAAPQVTGRLMSASYQHPQHAQQRQSGLQPGYAAPQGQPTQRPWQPHQAVQQAASAQYPQQPSCQPLVLPNLLSSLLSSGLLTVPPSVSIAPSGMLPAMPAVSYTHPPSRAGTPEAVDPEDCKFVPSRLKVLSWPLVITAANAFELFHAGAMHVCTCACCLVESGCVGCIALRAAWCPFEQSEKDELLDVALMGFVKIVHHVVAQHCIVLVISNTPVHSQAQHAIRLHYPISQHGFERIVKADMP